MRTGVQVYMDFVNESPEVRTALLYIIIYIARWILIYVLFRRVVIVTGLFDPNERCRTMPFSCPLGRDTA